MACLTDAKICAEPESIEFTKDYSNTEGVTYAPNSKVEIKIRCENLSSKFNPKVFVFFEERVYNYGVPESKWLLVGSTETAKNEQNPSFAKSFVFEYYFQYVKYYLLLFIIYYYYYLLFFSIHNLIYYLFLSLF